MKEIIYNGITFKYSIENLINTLDKYSWEEPYGNNYVDKGYMSKTEEDFNHLKNEFKTLILDLDNTIESLIKQRVVFTKANTLHKGRRHLILVSDIITSYSDEHGSHSYDSVCLFPKFTSEKEAILELSTFGFQDSF